MKNIFFNKETRAIADLVPFEGGMLITRINVPQAHRGRGYGSALLKEILSEADITGTPLFLQIMDSGGLTYGQLRLWYERYGFKQSGMFWVRRPRPAPKPTSGSI